MLPAANRLAGESHAFPDICKTPNPFGLPIDVPYYNIGENMSAVTFALTVLITGGNALNMASIIGTSLGDEPGVLHQTFMGPVSFITGSPKVIIEGTPAIPLLASTFQNLQNASGVHVVPSLTNVFYMLAPPDAEVEIETATAHEGALRSALDHALEITDTLGGDEREIASCLLPGSVGLIAIRVFSGCAPARVHAALRALEERGMESIFIDLRGNPGGEVTAAIELAGDFLAKGSVIATLIDADGDETVYRAQSERLYDLPVTLLVDRRTASASELFAASLRSHRRAVIIGETTYGKGYAQAFVPGIEGSMYRTIARVTFPDGRELHGQGIEPDILMDPGLTALSAQECPRQKCPREASLASQGPTSPQAR